ncbi:putative monooxygenase [Conidiobolus coronatus NRRL 28638]|uniref:Putative monooxygenase n=1 Tax=Conidiobolus coronatus (strain ATCC 28846 / CBS 209.66 / NRRL 28638) TaxID=796925 RepID=A0A137P558_CONC2|nr:putative monooxygenase [Conidiobolus coronatus NRRL 28638]|eukprot:KXN70150.1 putative monooxygenase [Conidiobolus coronatus NRRL 28638]
MKKIAVIGCGLGGAAITVMLQKAGFNVKVYEQAKKFLKIGAGIHLTPNVVKALSRVGIKDSLMAISSKPNKFLSKDAHTGEVIAELVLDDVFKKQFNAPYLTVHRGEFHALMVNEIIPSSLTFNKKLKEIIPNDNGVYLNFEDGSHDYVDIVIGADGLSSVVRSIVCKDEPPSFSGQAAFRALVDIEQLKRQGIMPDDLTKWWSDDRFVIAYYMNNSRDQLYFVAGFPEYSWPQGIQFLEAEKEEMLKIFSDFHEIPLQILKSAKEVKKWPLYERPAESAWSKGRVVLLGDACHPMRPHMAQGAAMAIEDGAILVRSLETTGLEKVEQAFDIYQKTRQDRVAKVQQISGENSWMRTTPDPTWLFTTDVWNNSLVAKKIISNKF